MSTHPEPAALLVHEPFLRALSRAILRGDDRADDVVQDTFLTAMEREPRDAGATKGWLRTIARNFSFRVRQRDAARRRRETAAAGGRPAIPSPAEIAEREEVRREVLAALLSLEEAYRDALVLRFYEDLPPRLVAERLGVPVETARTRVKRGLAALRKKLDEGRDRRSWTGLLLPLARLEVAPALPAAAGVLAGVKAVVAVAVLGAAAAGTWWAVNDDPAPDGAAPAAVPPAVGAPSPGAPGVEPEEEPADSPDTAPIRRESGTPARSADDAPPSAGPPDAGMAHVPAGEFRMGLDERVLREMFQVGKRSEPPYLKGDDQEFWWWFLKSEGPEHEAETEAYLIDRYAVTNAQYERFLDATANSRVLIGGKTRSIFDVARQVYGESLAAEQERFVYWRNAEKLEGIRDAVFAANARLVESVIDAFNADLPPAARADRVDELPEQNRVDAWLRFRLPEGTALVVYRRPVPLHWEKGRIPEGEEDCPVRWVSALDAEAFAAWAGKHLPTEAEWEKAARGPKGFLYPWGNEWKWASKNKNVATIERNRVVWQGAAARDARPPGPHYPMKDRPIPVDALPESASPYGLHHMIGNTLEWTSSIPELYEGSTADKWPFLGKPGYRVLRSQAYGSGYTYRDMELRIRNTARVMSDGVRSGIEETRKFGGVGFRCARYPTPARDSLAHRIARLARSGRLAAGFEINPARAYGVERPATDEEAAHGVFVTGMTRYVGVAPVDHRTRDGVRLVAFLAWSPDLTLDDAPERSDCLLGFRDGAPVLVGFGPAGFEVTPLPEERGRRSRELGNRTARIFPERGIVRLVVPLESGKAAAHFELPFRGAAPDGWRETR